MKMLRGLIVGGMGIAVAIVIAFSAGSGHTSTASASVSYLAPPANGNGVTLQWAWQIGSQFSASQLTSAPISSANIIDTDDFDDATTMGANDEPSGPSSVVGAIHAAGKYSVCYIEAGAQQAEPDSGHFAAADYGNDASQYQMQGYPGEYWYDTRGFAAYKYGDSSSVLTGAAPDIAAGMAERIAGCKAEGQDAIEPDDLDGYTNPGNTGVAGGGWGLTQADAAGYEAWLATTAHADGLAIFQKNDGGNTTVDEPNFDGMIIEECNYYEDPCGSGGDNVQDYINAGKPVLNAEYTQDGETTSKFCPADIAAGMAGALFDVNLAGGTYEPCQTGSGYTYPGNGGTTSTSTSSTQTSSSSSSTTPTSSSTSSTSTTVSSTSTSPPPPPKGPVNTKAPKLSGTAKQGDQLKTTNGSWTGSPTSYTYQWTRCKSTCVISGNAKKQTYSLASRDVGYKLEAIVTAHNHSGSASAHSGESAVVVVKNQGHYIASANS